MPMLKTTVYLYRYQPEYLDTPVLVAAGYKSNNPEYILVDTRELTVEVQHADYYIPEKVRMLREQKDKVYVDAQQEIAVIDDKIAKLLCLEAPARQQAGSDDDGLPF